MNISGIRIDSFEDAFILDQLRHKIDAALEDSSNEYCFMFRTHTDDYNYVVLDRSGREIFCHYLGSEAYQRFIRDDEAWQIGRYPKMALYQIHGDKTPQILLTK